MIDRSDYIVKKIGHNGKRYKLYRIRCNSCCADRGYQLPNQDKRPSCNKCSKLGSKISEETRAKMSAGAFNRKPRQKKRVDGRTIRDRSTYRGPKKFVSALQNKIRHSVRTAIWQKLTRRGILRKTNRTFALLGYSPQDLISHLEAKFQPGMTWENYGEWHIDHIVPDSWFQYDSSDHEAFKKSWSLENLQPMWAKMNHIKGNRYASSSL